MKIKFGNVLIFFLSAIFLTKCESSINEYEYGSTEDYQIYSLVLNEIIKDERLLIVLQDSTSSESFIGENRNYFTNQLPGLDEETFNNFIQSNSYKVKLKRIKNVSHKFSSEYKHKPGETVSVNLAQVGFNKAKTQALVSMGFLYAPLVGYGNLIFLTRYGFQWKINKIIITWIS